MPVRDRQRFHAVLVLRLQPEPGAARRQHLQSRRGGEEIGHQGRGGQHVLEVVEQKQNLALAEIVRQRPHQILPGLLSQPERRSGGRWDKVRVRQAGEIDGERAIGERLQRLRRNPQSQPRLANPAGAGEGHQANIGPQQKRPDFLHFPLPAQKRRRRRGQVVGKRVWRVERREIRTQGRMAELENLFGLQDVTQAVLAQRLQGRGIWQGIARQFSDGAAEQNLLAVGRVEETR